MSETFVSLINRKTPRILILFMLVIAGLLALTNCLDSGNKELLVACCGVLVNMMSDENNREAFKNYNGVSKMVNILQSPEERDWTLSALICQTLWNVCSGSDSFPGDPMTVLDTLVKLTGKNRATSATKNKNTRNSNMYNLLIFFSEIIILCVRIDEEQLFGELLSLDEEKVAEYKQWEDFASVATNLLEWLDELLEGRFDNVEN